MATYAWIGTTSTAWNTTTNWLPNGTPGNSDTVIFDGRAVKNCVAYDASATTLALLRITSAFTYQIGTFSSGVVTPLQVGATNVIIGEPDADGNIGAGSNGIALDFGSTVGTVRVLNTATVGTSGFAPVLLRGTATANVLIVSGGWVHVGGGGNTSSLNDTATVQNLSLLGPAANVETSGGTTLTTVNQLDGRILFRSAVTTFNQEGGVAQSEGTGTITTADVGGTFVSNSTGTITTANVQNGGVLDLSQNNAARTITNATLFGTGRLLMPIPYSAITFTNGVDLTRGARSEQIVGAADVTVSFSAL